MRVAKRWRKQFIPIVMLLAPTEDTRQYSIMYSIGSLLLQRVLTRLGWDRPEKLFAQIHSDFAKSAADAAETSLPGALLVNDLEHLFRNLRRQQSEEKPQKKQLQDEVCIHRDV